MSWRKGFSEELSGEKRANIMKEAVGKTIICEDGIHRRVVEITFSMKWPWKVIINEKDPDSQMGHWVSVYSLCAQVLGEPLPNPKAEEAFVNHMKVKFGIQDDGHFEKPPEDPNKSSLILPHYLRR